MKRVGFSKNPKILMENLRRFLKRHFIPVLLILFASTIGIIIFEMLQMSNKIIKSTALEDAGIYVEAIESFRSLYTSDVVERVRPKGIIVTHNYKDIEGAIPLPATLTKKIGMHIEKIHKGMKVRLYSDYPFPWNTNGGPNDDFEKKALQYLGGNPEKPFFSFEKYNGTLSLRYAKADLMRASCVACHNSHPQTPKNDWKEGDVRGVLEIVLPMARLGLGSVKFIRERIILFIVIGGLAIFSFLHILNWLDLKSTLK